MLGEFDVLIDGAPVPLGGPRQRGVLLLLALSANTVVPAGRLVERLWSGQPPPSATGTLQAYISRLRSALAPAPATIETTSVGYRLIVEPEAVDATRFQQAVHRARAGLAEGRHAEAAAVLAEASTLWRGPALVGVAADLAPEDATRFEELRVVAAELRVDAELALGGGAGVVGELEALVAEHPLREGLWARLMQALHASGRTAEALRAYQSLRTQLVEELGLEPSAQLVALEGSILRQDPALLPPPPRPRTRPPPLLPVPLTRFVGRRNELDAALTAVEHARLVTVTGPGGTGKTRLAIEVALELRTRGVSVGLVELIGVVHPTEVVGTFGTAVGARPDGREPLDAVVESLQGDEWVLILDNCEHVLDAVAELADDLLRRCPGLRLLATSREALGMTGERLLPLPPLPLPAAGDALSAQRDADAVRLFVERGRDASPGYDPDDDELAVVVEICTRLDGIPLALELAASRLRALSVSQIAERLDDRFRLLRSSGRGAQPNQTALEATLDWSYALLSGSERHLFARLSVFAAGFPLEHVEVVAGPELDADEVLDVLAALVSKSLVERADGSAGPRYRLLETVRAYSAGRLREAGDGAAVRDLHADALLATVEAVAPLLDASADIAAGALERLDAEHADLRLAFDHLVAEGDGGRSTRMASAWWRWFEQRWLLAEGRERLCRVRAVQGGPASARADATVGEAILALLDDDLDAAGEAAERGLTEAELGPRGRGVLLTVLAEVARESNDARRAEALATEAVELLDEHDATRQRALAVRVLALLARDRADLRAAEASAAECLRLSQACGFVEGAAGALSMLSSVAWDRGDLSRARELAETALPLFREAGEPWGEAQAVVSLARLAIDAGDLERSLTLAERGTSLHDALGHRRWSALAALTVAEAASGLGWFDRAEGLVDAAVLRLRERGFRSDVAEALRVAAELALRRGEPSTCAELATEALEADGENEGRHTADLLRLLGLARTRTGAARVGRRLCLEARVRQAASAAAGARAAVLEALAEAALGDGDDEEAAFCLLTAERVRALTGVPRAPADVAAYERLATLVRGDDAVVIDLRERTSTRSGALSSAAGTGRPSKYP